MKLNSVSGFNIYALGAEPISYHLRAIHTMALQVTEENIGILALEFETELTYCPEGDVSLKVWVERTEAAVGARILEFYPTDWIVVLWDEFHLFRDKEFQHTFSFDSIETPLAAEPDAPRMTDEDIKKVGAQIEENFSQGTEIMRPVAAPGIEDSGPMTAIITAVGELDTDEANGKID